VKTPLEELSVAKPRPAGVCMRLARRLDPAWGFVVAGLIWAVLALSIATVVLMQVIRVLDLADGSTGSRIASLIVLPLGAVAGFYAFRHWRRARLRGKEMLLRDGALVEATVLKRSGDLEETEVKLLAKDRELRCVFHRWFAPAEGSSIRLIHHPATAHVVAFDRHGAMYSGHVRGGQLGRKV
jgi:hypothetical protein